jgi:4'-phosphopantetheinyl transferase
MTPIEREPPMDAAFDLAIARCPVAPGLTFACATVNDRIAPATQTALERMLDTEESAVYAGLTDASDRRCWAAARGLLRIELSLLLALGPQDWEYVPRPGRPSEIRTPLGRVDKFRFSQSHTRGMVACAVSDTSAGPYGEVGIDVEWVRELPDMEELAEQNFPPGEVMALRELPPAEQRKRFFSLWTLRQAWDKARCLRAGAPRTPLESSAIFTFDETGTIPRANFTVGRQDPSNSWRFWLHALDDVHVLALAARQRQLVA